MTAIIIIVVIIGLIYLSHVIQKRQIDKQNQIKIQKLQQVNDSASKERRIQKEQSTHSDKLIEVDNENRYKENDTIPYETWITDVNEINNDGISRQEVLAKCQIGDSLTFKLFETKNDFNMYRIEVSTEHGIIGNVDYLDDKPTVARYIKNGGIIHNAKIILLKYPKTSRGKISCKISFERNKMR